MTVMRQTPRSPTTPVTSVYTVESKAGVRTLGSDNRVQTIARR